MTSSGDDFRIEPLGAGHNRSSFECGAELLDRYLREQAGQDARKNIAAPFVLALSDGTVAGYYTLSATAINLAELPEKTARKLPRYPLLPATLLDRLKVDRRHQGKGYSRFMLAVALFRAFPQRNCLFCCHRRCQGRNTRAVFINAKASSSSPTSQ